MKERQLGLYLDDQTLQMVDRAKEALRMNRSEFIRYCIFHVLDESQVLRSTLKRAFEEWVGEADQLGSPSSARSRTTEPSESEGLGRARIEGDSQVS